MSSCNPVEMTDPYYDEAFARHQPVEDSDSDDETDVKGQMMGESAKQTLLGMNEKLKEENKKLKDEIKKINQEWEMEVNECRAIYFRRMEDIKKLKEENEKLKETIKEQQKEIDIVLKERREGDEEHQKLLDDIELHPDYEDTIKSTIETAQKELKKENDKFTKYIVEQHGESQRMFDYLIDKMKKEQECK